MCYTTLLGLAAATAGSAIKARQGNNTINAAQSASDRVLKRDQARQRQLEDERRASLAASLRSASAPNQTANMNAIRQQTEADYAAAGAPDTTTRDAPPSQNAGSGQGEVNAEYARQLADALTDYKKSSTAQAKVRSYDANKLRLGVAMQGNAGDIATNAGIARADNAAAQIEAQRAYAKKMRRLGKFGIGDALQLGGGVASMAGSSGYGVEDFADLLPQRVAFNPAMGGEMNGQGSSY